MRPEPFLPDEAVVVVGGLMALASLQKAVEKSVARGERPPRVSVWSSLRGLDADGVVRAAQEVEAGAVWHGRLRESTAGGIRAAGFALRPEGNPGHYAVVLSVPTTDTELEALRGVFEEPRVNPAAGGKNVPPTD